MFIDPRRIGCVRWQWQKRAEEARDEAATCAPHRADLDPAAGVRLPAETARAQTRKPSANEIASIRTCATRNQDNLEDGERRCLFRLVAQPCMGKRPDDASEQPRPTASGWKARSGTDCSTKITRRCSTHWIPIRPLAPRPCSAPGLPIAIRPASSTTTRSAARCRSEHAACVARETARRAMLLKFFVDL